MARSPAPAANRLRIVVADDMPEIRALLRKSLDLDESIEVVGEAPDGAEAVEMIRRLRPDVVLLDLAMPVMDGLEAIPEIVRYSPNTHIVVLSGVGESVVEGATPEAGVSAFLPKGTGPDEILATVHGVADSPDSTTEHGSVEAEYRRQHDLLPLLTHELGNQLSVIQGFAELLLDGTDELPPATRRHFAEAIVRNARQMRDLLATASDVRKLDLGTIELKVQEVDLAHLVGQALSDLSGMLGDRRVGRYLPPHAYAVVDPVRVRQVVTNLVSNATKFTPSDATVEVTVTVLPDTVEVTVADNGPGIPKERQGQLFGKFARLGSTVKGSGVGLYLSRGIARAHGGDLVLVPSDRGCRFVLSVPRLKTRE